MFSRSNGTGRVTAPRWGMLLSVVVAAGFAAPASALAATAPSPATITSAFTPATISVGSTTALSFTITNPNLSATLSGVAFTDTLPAGVIVDNPNGESGSCSSTTTGVTANPGSSTISLSGGKLTAGASCTVSADVTATGPGTYTNATGSVSSTQTVTPPYNIASGGNGSIETLRVIGNPTITIAAPINHATFAYGQKVKARYTCTEAAGGPGLSTCQGSDANGDNINAGRPIDTKDAGEQSLTVTAISNDGAIVTDTVNYKVRPDNQLTGVKVTGHSDGKLTLSVTAPGPGKLTALATVAGIRGTFSSKTVKRGSKGKLTLTLSPGTTAATALKGLTGSVTATVTLTYTPKGGRPGKVTVKGVKL
jgi:hypothetical protein